MLDWVKRILDWNRRRRRWNTEHVEAWAGYDRQNEDGITVFQVRCETALSEHLRRRGVPLTARSLQDAPGTERGTDIRARLAGSAWWIVIYRDGAEILREVREDDDPQETRGPCREGLTLEHDLEQWDGLTPDDLIARYCRTVDSVLTRIGL